ncbi:FAD/NAD(P)-binding domain-containing protein [Bimuria novae-zelandiae CBS 107.79]|uniref:FAD/NAD(P)-binding domain-containing protein n=1 Tax=Bimuria novae-zelandiae CBS 107.79 TaxID=1447943 RepID=A0A6A5UZ03_9PLEO|nr:FAD/NAD(P)-binding domain-containing protein [Bimuria novae-zelandiae CBS 107.79]
MARIVDVLIIGGGPAGLTAASILARQVITCVIFDNGTYRNKLSNEMHTVLTAENGSPEAFRAKARQELLQKYETIAFQDTTIAKVTKLEGGFEAEDRDGTKWQGKKLILATGVEDIFPAIEGYAECWAVGIYHCIFCKGFEDRGADSCGLLAIDKPMNIQHAMNAARMASQFSKRVVFYTNGDEALAAQFVAVFPSAPVFSSDSRKIAKLVKGPSGGQVIIHFENGMQTTEGFIFHKPLTKAKGPFAEQLGLETTPEGDLVVKPPFAQTSDKDVFAAGDNASLFKMVTVAMHMGGLAGAQVASRLAAEKLGQTSLF